MWLPDEEAALPLSAAEQPYIRAPVILDLSHHTERQSDLGAPVILDLSHQYPSTHLRPPASSTSSSYSSIIPALKSENHQNQNFTEAELAQIQAMEHKELRHPATLEEKFTGRDICNKAISPDQYKDYNNLKKIWVEAGHKCLIRKILDVLNYYTCDNSVLKPFLTLGRNNLTEIEPIIKHINEIQKAGISIDDSSDELSEQVMTALYAVRLNNSKGTLATVIQFLTQQMQVTRENENRYGLSFKRI